MLLCDEDKLLSMLITNECLDGRIKSGVPGILIKLDMKKDFDYVSWDFLLFLLGKYGFGQKWYLWMKLCITTPKFFILVNGSPTGFFAS